MMALAGSCFAADFTDKSADPNAMPEVPAEFEVQLFAGEPLVRQPCSMAFDAKGRLFVGMGPQYRSPKPETPGDSVVMVLDTDGDGQADSTKVFAIGFNAIQGLAWHGRDLWIANAPDLTLVRDLDGDDQADQYVRVYTDLGNLEHGLHGLNWAPDGKLYMSKGNSKGLNQPDRYAPKPFRDLWGVTAPAGVPDFPAPVTFDKGSYQHAYHHPSDDWGMDGGVLRCDDGGENLEIVARGFRNPWDITMDSGFNWLGTDNDQSEGDRVFVPFFGAHFGWNHPWSSHWSTETHAPTAPVSGPLFEGSGTGVIFCMSPQFPPEYRGTFLVNDWLSKKTYLWRPEWRGALMRPEGGAFTPFIEGGSSLFRPTDLEFGPDGALWVLGWSSGYGAEYEDGELSNEGRIYRIVWKDAMPPESSLAGKSLDTMTLDELIRDFDSPLPVRRIDAQDELVRRGAGVTQPILDRLSDRSLTENQETWSIWTLGRMPEATALAGYLHEILLSNDTEWVNRQVQAVRILSYRANQLQQTDRLLDSMRLALGHTQPRVRFAAVQAIHEAELKSLVPDLLRLLEQESDETVYYAGWQSLRILSSQGDLRALMTDPRGSVRRAALLSLLETHGLTLGEVREVSRGDTDPEIQTIAKFWIKKIKGAAAPAIKGRSLREASGLKEVQASIDSPATLRNLKSRGSRPYKIVPGGFVEGNLTYVDRRFRLTSVPPALVGSDLIQTANSDESSTGSAWLNVEAVVPVRVLVGIDQEQEAPPKWLTTQFEREPFTASIDEGATLVFYSRTFDQGAVTLGGNTDNGDAGSMVNYIIAATPIALEQRDEKITAEDVFAVSAQGSPLRGEILFRHSRGAGCAKCHSVDAAKNGFGPNLSQIGSRSNASHIVQSIVAPSQVITEGFNQQTVVTEEGETFSGVLLEESGLSLSLGQSNGEQVDIPKSMIDERKRNPVSAMPDLADTLTALQVADLTAFLLSLKEENSQNPPNSNSEKTKAGKVGFRFERDDRQLQISLDGKSIVEFVFRDEKTLRPYFSNARLLNGLKVTRNHPPLEGVDELDHAALHPGIWLAFGDINGHDFWRNKASMEHVRFVLEPTVEKGQLRFSTECRLESSAGQPICTLINKYMLASRPLGWMLIWSAEFRAGETPVIFGDQEEMGFGARVATSFTETNGGLIRSSTGNQTAKSTWGQSARWCDYSSLDAKAGGIMLMASPTNFRESWWHNRNYGAFVSNPFGRQAMKQGDVSRVVIQPGESLQLTFGALIHEQENFNAAGEYESFLKMVRE